MQKDKNINWTEISSPTDNKEQIFVKKLLFDPLLRFIFFGDLHKLMVEIDYQSNIHPDNTLFLDELYSNIATRQKYDHIGTLLQLLAINNIDNAPQLNQIHIYLLLACICMIHPLYSKNYCQNLKCKVLHRA